MRGSPSTRSNFYTISGLRYRGLGMSVSVSGGAVGSRDRSFVLSIRDFDLVAQNPNLQAPEFEEHVPIWTCRPRSNQALLFRV